MACGRSGFEGRGDIFEKEGDKTTAASALFMVATADTALGLRQNRPSALERRKDVIHVKTRLGSNNCDVLSSRAREVSSTPP